MSDPTQENAKRFMGLEIHVVDVGDTFLAGIPLERKTMTRDLIVIDREQGCMWISPDGFLQMVSMYRAVE